jgi:hypothetical protein
MTRATDGDAWPEIRLKQGWKAAMLRPGKAVKGYIGGDGNHFMATVSMKKEMLPKGEGRKAGPVIE